MISLIKPGSLIIQDRVEGIVPEFRFQTSFAAFALIINDKQGFGARREGSDSRELHKQIVFPFAFKIPFLSQ